MKMHVLVAAVLTAATITACSSSGGSGNAGGGNQGGSPTGAGQTGTNHTAASANFCKQLSTAVHKTSGLQSAIANPQQLATRMHPIISAFESLKAQAPANVSTSIDDLLTAMQGAQKDISGGNPQALRQKLMKVVPKLEHDFTVLGQYVRKKCAGTG